jgi:glycosyltransferase involved in cell wall biosynthesis
VTTGPKVSIILPTYNGERFLKTAIDSVLNQTFEDFELIIIIDGSTDRTIEIIRSFNDSRIILRENEKNLGLPNCLNSGLDMAKGKYYMYFSDDDILLPNAIKVMFDYLGRHPESAAVMTEMYYIDENGKIKSKTADGGIKSLLVKTDVAIKIGKYRPEYFLLEDADFLIRLIYHTGPLPMLKETCYLYRDHKNNLSHIRAAEIRFISVKLHHDLIKRKIEKGNLKKLFFDNVSKIILYGDSGYANKVIEFAEEKKLPFVKEIKTYISFLHTPHGRMYNRVKVALYSRAYRLKKKLFPNTADINRFVNYDKKQIIRYKNFLFNI